MSRTQRFALGCCVLAAAACASEADPHVSATSSELSSVHLDLALRAVIAFNGLHGTPAAGVQPPPQPLADLGALLFFDKILGGEQNQACVSCHHPLTATGDGLRLSRGVGSSGVGRAREDGPGPIIPRNAPPVWNGILFDVQFWDGRVSEGADGVIRSPDGVETDVDTALWAQAKFPVTSVDEMRGTFMPHASNQALRDALAARVAAIPQYVELFSQVFGDETVTYTRIAEAMAAYEASLTPVDAPWFSYVRGARGAISTKAKRGALVFYGKGRCGLCHSGDRFTDLAFHNLGIPQFGPGKGDGADGQDDFGRERVTGRAADRYKFRTPTLINVDTHAPYGHDGAYASLEAIVRHHLDPVRALRHYDYDQGTLEPVFRSSLRPTAPLLATLDPLVAWPVHLSERELGDLLAFLATLTDEQATAQAVATIPSSVPSGLPIDQP